MSVRFSHHSTLDNDPARGTFGAGRMQGISPRGTREGTVGSVSFVDTVPTRDDRHRRQGALPCHPMVQPAVVHFDVRPLSARSVHFDVRPLSARTVAAHYEVAR